ncbi:MAG: hypothetical protein AAFZ80_07715 [Cyanobacteria bacterium P01_A01_bin.105]
MMTLKFDHPNAVAIAALSLSLGTALLLPTEAAQASVFGDSASVVNTFEDAVLTGGLQTLFGNVATETVTDALEFPNFIGFYDIDVSESSLTWTLVDNSSAADLILPANRFDRYYLQFENSTVTSVSLDGSDELNEFASVEVLAPGFSLEPADFFGTGIPTPIEFENGGLLVQFNEGTDLTNLGVSAKVNFTSEPVPEPATAIPALLVGGFMVARSMTRKRRAVA